MTGALTPGRVAIALWLLWLASWLIAARWSTRTVKRPGLGRQAIDRVLVGAGVVFLFAPWSRYGVAEPRLWDLNGPGAWSLIAPVVLGFVFTWWARLHLGRLWSGSVTQKQGHRIVDTGPYGLVRHPIYTGLLLSAVATAALKATVIGLAGTALITLGLYLKARLEERFLSGDLGAEYEAYRARVPMLVPFIGKRG